MNAEQREKFDALVDDVVAELPASLLKLLEQTPAYVEDRPSEAIAAELGLQPDDVLCGLHTGVALTERTHDTAELEYIHLFRDGIVATAGGWSRAGASARIREEIRVTLLHEIGHHYGLDEGDLDELGFG